MTRMLCTKGELCLLTEALEQGSLHVAFQIHFAFQNKNNGHRSDLHVKHPGPHSYSTMAETKKKKKKAKTMAETENTEGD